MRKIFFALTTDARLEATVHRYEEALLTGSGDRASLRRSLLAEVAERSRHSVAISDDDWVALQDCLSDADVTLRRLSAQLVLSPSEAGSLAAGVRAAHQNSGASLLADFLSAAAREGSTVVALAV